MASLQKFIDRMRYWCEQGNLGYDQGNRQDIRYGGECDCSSLVIFALKEAGFDTGNATYTGNMSSNLTARGWKRIPNNGRPQAGDILLNDANHVAVWLGDKLAQASKDENGRYRGGKSGDQSNYETNTRGYYNYPWSCYLRYVGNSSATSSPSNSSSKLSVDGYWGCATTRAVQKALGTTQDGIVSGQDAGDLAKCNRGGLESSSWQIGHGGSMMVRALQRKIGANPDGYFGVNTCRALQKYLGTTQDGIVSAPSSMVKELQRRLNDGKF